MFYDLTCCFFVLFLYFLTSYNLLSNYSCLSDEIYHTQLNSFMQNMSSILLFSYLLATIFSFIFLNNGFYEFCVRMCIMLSLNFILVPYMLEPEVKI